MEWRTKPRGAKKFLGGVLREAFKKKIKSVDFFHTSQTLLYPVLEGEILKKVVIHAGVTHQT